MLTYAFGWTNLKTDIFLALYKKDCMSVIFSVQFERPKGQEKPGDPKEEFLYFAIVIKIES